MSKITTILSLFFFVSIGFSQTQVIDAWKFNSTGTTASYWQNTGSNQTPNFVFYTTTVISDIKKVCYDNNYVYINSDGMTQNMGQFLNPGAPSAQNFVYRFVRNPAAATSKTSSPYVGSIGMLINGVPIYGLGSAKYYNGTSNNGQGTGTWNVEVKISEGVSLDYPLGAHPQQQGIYHSHARPIRLYSTTGTNTHSPILGYAFDGFPVYGPYGYTNATVTGVVKRMVSGYSLRNITTRTSLPYNVTLTSTNYGPAVNTTYPIGTYIEDYEWSASNGGDLDKYNGRFCVTPEYPNGTYAYFVTIDASGNSQFPYYIGLQYYGTPDATNLSITQKHTIPTSGYTCLNSTVSGTTTGINDSEIDSTVQNIWVFPNPAAEKKFTLTLPNLSGESLVQIFSVNGETIYNSTFVGNTHFIDLEKRISSEMVFLKVYNAGKVYTSKIIF